MPTGVRFPAALPPPELAGYGEEDEDIRSRVPMEIGSERIRNRYRRSPLNFEVSWTFTSSQFGIFEYWFQEAIQGGTRQFDIQLSDGAFGLVWYTVRQLADFDAEIVGEMLTWRVRWKLRAIGLSFGSTRPAGTDELRGITTVGANCSGVLVAYTPLRGLSNVGVTSARSRFALPELYGRAAVGMFRLPRASFTVLPYSPLVCVNYDELEPPEHFRVIGEGFAEDEILIVTEPTV